MFSVVRELHREMHKTALREIFSQRKRECFEYLDTLEKTQKLSIPFYRTFDFSSFCKIKYVRRMEEYVLCLSPLLLIEPYEIPFEFIRTEDYQGIRDYVSEKAGLEKKQLSSDEKKHIKLYFELIKDLPLAKEAVKFLFLRTFKKHTERSTLLEVINVFLLTLTFVLVFSHPLISCVLAIAVLINFFVIKKISSPSDIETVESLQGDKANLAKGALYLWRCEQLVNSNASEEIRNQLSSRIISMQAHLH